MMRPQWIAWIVLGIVAAYVVFTTLARLDDGRCRAFGTGLDCSFRKPLRIEIPAGKRTVAALDTRREDPA